MFIEVLHPLLAGVQEFRKYDLALTGREELSKQIVRARGTPQLFDLLMPVTVCSKIANTAMRPFSCTGR